MGCGERPRFLCRMKARAAAAAGPEETSAEASPPRAQHSAAVNAVSTSTRRSTVTDADCTECPAGCPVTPDPAHGVPASGVAVLRAAPATPPKHPARL